METDDISVVVHYVHVIVGFLSWVGSIPLCSDQNHVSVARFECCPQPEALFQEKSSATIHRHNIPNWTAPCSSFQLSGR